MYLKRASQHPQGGPKQVIGINSRMEVGAEKTRHWYTHEAHDTPRCSLAVMVTPLMLSKLDEMQGELWFIGASRTPSSAPAKALFLMVPVLEYFFSNAKPETPNCATGSSLLAIYVADFFCVFESQFFKDC